MVIKILFILFGAFLFLFLYWRRLKEDYISSMIFSSFFCLLLGVVLFVFLANQFFPIWWFWSAVLGLSLGLAATLFRFKFRFFETLEAVTISGLSWLSLVFLGDALANQCWFSLAGFGRQVFAYPDFANDIITQGGMEREKCCIACGKCTEIMRFGGRTGCVIRDAEVYLPIYKNVSKGK